MASSDHNKPPLTDDAVRFIRNNRGVIPGAKLGEMFGRSQGTINAIQKRWTYKLVPMTDAEVERRDKTIAQHLDREAHKINKEKANGY